jgi:hypothetical protein
MELVKVLVMIHFSLTMHLGLVKLAIKNGKTKFLNLNSKEIK